MFSNVSKIYIEIVAHHTSGRESALPMADPFRLFVNVRKFHRILGLDPRQTNPQWILNWRNVLICYALAQMYISLMAFCIFEAQTLFEYGCAIYVGITELACIFAYIFQYISMAHTLDWIEKLEKFMEKRTSTVVRLHLIILRLVLMCVSISNRPMEKSPLHRFIYQTE